MEQTKKKAVLVMDGKLYRIIGLEERAEIGFIHRDYPAHNMKRYFTKVRDYLGYEILNIDPYIEDLDRRLKELE